MEFKKNLLNDDDYSKKIKKDEYIMYAEESALERNLRDFQKIQDICNQLLQSSNIANMDQVVVSTPDKPIIGTQALDTCFGILIYDRKNKFGICGHASTGNIYYIVIQMLKNIPQNYEGTLEYTIVPGYRAI